MKIYTGNFANVKKYRENGIEPINIALSARYFKGIKFPLLTPEWSFMDDSRPDYIRKFNAKIAKYDAKLIFQGLKQLAQGKDVALCCHEKEGDFCHRRLVAEWLTKELSIEVKELGRMAEPEKKVTKPIKPIQHTLFL